MANLNAEELSMLISKDNAKSSSDSSSVPFQAGQATRKAVGAGVEAVGGAVKSQVEPIAKGMNDYFKGLFAEPENPDQVVAQSILPAFQEAAPDVARNLAQDPKAFFGVYHQLAGMAGPTINQQVLKEGIQSSGFDDQGNPESIMSLPKGLLSDTTGELSNSEVQKSSEGLQKAENVMNKAQSRAAEFGAKPEKGVMGHISGALGRFFGTPAATAANEAARTMGGMPAGVATAGYAGQLPLTTYEQAQLGQQAQFKQAEQYGAATERMTNLLKATQGYSYPLLRPLGLVSKAEKTAMGQLYGTSERPSGMVKKYGEEIAKIGETKVEKLKSKVPEISKSQRATYNRVFESTGSREKARKAAGF